MKNLKAGFAIAVLIVCAVLLFLQHQAQEKLRADNEALTQQIAQLKTDNGNLSNLAVQAKSPQSLPNDQFNELLKLRGEVGMLRQQVGELGKLREENRELHAEIAPMRSQSAQLPTEAQHEWYKTNTINAMKWLGLDMRIYAGDHNDKYATNFDQLIEAHSSITNFPVGINAIEFVNAGLVSGQYPQMIIFRERVSRRTPDGRWERVYGMADGSVWTQTSDDGNFDAFEQQHMVSPPPNQ